jgi:multidrug efflux pump subunit AcrA (membrane-fusion protein)
MSDKAFQNIHAMAKPREKLLARGQESGQPQVLSTSDGWFVVAVTPQSVRNLGIGGVIILLFCAALLWASWGTIDIVASATGKSLPGGRVKVVQPFETGVVRTIRVQDGQVVKAGGVLIELDPTANEA